MIRFELNGKKVAPGGLVKAWEAAARKGIEDNMERRLREALTVEEFTQISWGVEGADLSNLTLNISGPDEIVAKAQEAIAD